MGVASQTLLFIINTIYLIFAAAVAARFLAQIARADFYNPLAQTVVKMTNPVLVPLRRVIPGFGGLDLAAIVLLYVTHVIYSILVAFILGMNPFSAIGVFFVFSLLATAGVFLNILFFGMFIVMIASWVSQGGVNPMVQFIMQIIEPFVGPFRKLNLQVGMIDLSFMVAAMVLFIIKNILLLSLTANLASQIGVGNWVFSLVGLGGFL